jgi:hypothetical protein
VLAQFARLSASQYHGQYSRPNSSLCVSSSWLEKGSTCRMCEPSWAFPRAVQANTFTNNQDSLLFFIDTRSNGPGHHSVFVHSVPYREYKDGGIFGWGGTGKIAGEDVTLQLGVPLTHKRFNDCSDNHTGIIPSSILITQSKNTYNHWLALLIKPSALWHRTRVVQTNGGKHICWHSEEVLPIYCSVCKTGVAIPDTLVDENSKKIIEHIAKLGETDQSHIKQLAKVLADLALADSLSRHHSQSKGQTSQEYLKAMEIFKNQVIGRYQLSVGQLLPEEIAHLTSLPRLQTYQISREEFLQNNRLVYV